MIKLPDPDWETYDKAIADAYLRAVNEWLEEIQPRLDPHGVLTAAAVGAETVATIGRLRPDVAFIGANGISAGFGLSTPDP